MHTIQSIDKYLVRARQNAHQRLDLILQVFPIDSIELIEDACDGRQCRLVCREQHFLTHQQNDLLTVIPQQQEVDQLTLKMAKTNTKDLVGS